MEQFIHFVITHWLLWVALVVVITLLVYEETKGSVKGVQKISAEKAVTLINHENAIVVDVRTAAEFQTGHINEARNIANNELEKNINKLNKYKNKPIILVCQAGQRSLVSGVILRKNGFEQVYSLTGGVGSWSRAGYPLVK